MTRIREILSYWFQGIDDNTVIERQAFIVKRWFAKDKIIDDDIRGQFESDIQKGRTGEYRSWEDNIRGRLALVILYDQFSRNIYRNTLRIFENDSLALELTLRTIQERRQGELPFIEQMFLFMPLMHSEDLHIQRMSLECFESLIKGSGEKSPANVSYYEYTFDFARRHYEIISKFGRFPHRNAILKRISTDEELAFLKQPGSGFR